jgi:uncharacterized membrane protein
MVSKIITREKHLDHMVRVVPLIVFAYAIQCYFISSMSPVEYAVDGLLFLGACLGLMIAGFVTYDLTHIVKLESENLVIEVKWLNIKNEISFVEIKEIVVSQPGESFSGLKLVLHSGKKVNFYFIDDADKVKAWIEQINHSELKKAA